MLSDEALLVPEEVVSFVPELLDPVPVVLDVTVPVPVVFAVPELVVVSSAVFRSVAVDAADVAVCVAVATDAV